MYNIIKSKDGIKSNYASFETLEAAQEEMRIIEFSYKQTIEDGVIEFTEDNDTEIKFKIIETNY